MRRAGLAAALMLALALAVLGCGRKGPPVAPGLPQEEPPRGLAYRVEGNRLELTWRNPAGLRQPLEFRVDRAALEPACRECPPRFVEVARQPTLAQGNYLFVAEGLMPATTYLFRVAPIYGPESEGPPAQVKVAFRSAPPPQGVVAMGVEGGVRVFWEPEVGARSYAVWRGEGAGELRRTGEAEVPPFFDAAAERGRTYRYAVAAINRGGEGPLSPEVSAAVPEQ